MPINSFSPPRIVIDTNSPAHAESSPHVRRTLDINRESDIHAVAGTLQTPISIHALRKESDPGTLRLTKRSKNFNPHSPCGERRLILPSRVLVSIFQSTLPLRGATGHTRHHPNIPCYFNPHSPCGERPASVKKGAQNVKFQSTLPLRGATSTIGSGVSGLVQFQSTLPLRGATWRGVQKTIDGIFQSTLPLRGATYMANALSMFHLFQSTLPLRGATLPRWW